MVKWGAMVDYVGWWWLNTRGWSAIDNVEQSKLIKVF